MKLEPIKLGKNMELKYLPFSELAIPWNVCVASVEPRDDNCEAKQLGVPTYGRMAAKSSRAPMTMKRDDLDALKRSIGQFGLLKPFEVAELPERLDFFYGKGKYVVIDGQRRYFAIREMLSLPTEHDERTQKGSLRTNSGYAHIEKAEIQAQEQFDRLSMRDYVLVPCLVYPYRTSLQMVRHSVEGKRLCVKPSKDDLDLAEKMHEQGALDLNLEDLSELWKTRSKIEEEKQALEETLQQIRKRIKEELYGEERTKLEDSPDTLITEEEPRKALTPPKI
ncbi:MAG: ParB N-terminal domain-containing protein [Candidatus Bathyarchaeota archaeon]|nr:MAG: ParB N-terminal domain-containing protein [Candidatus Bathyarchaeota archaeon]